MNLSEAEARAMRAKERYQNDPDDDRAKLAHKTAADELRYQRWVRRMGWHRELVLLQTEHTRLKEDSEAEPLPFDGCSSRVDRDRLDRYLQEKNITDPFAKMLDQSGG